MSAVGDIITVNGRRERVTERVCISRPAQLPDGTSFQLEYHALRTEPIEDGAPHGGQ